MKGMELAKAYFEEYGIQMIEGQFGEYKGKIAAGLVGEGSECLGFDDEFSQDHDFVAAAAGLRADRTSHAAGLRYASPELQRSHENADASGGRPGRSFLYSAILRQIHGASPAAQG